MNRPRVLLIAEAANPEWTSVPLVGWSHVRAIAEVTDAHIVTQIRNREAIERFGWKEGREFTALDTEALAKPVYRLSSLLSGGKGKGWTTLTAFNALSYYYFEHKLWHRFKEALKRGDFDLVHRVTPLSPVIPSRLAKKCRRLGIPFVLGPLNGGVPWPKGFDRERRREREWLSYVRWIYKILPGYRATRRNASAIIMGSRDTLKQLPAVYHDKVIYVPENAIDPERFSLHADRPAELPLKLAYLGRLVPYKCPDLAVRASADLIRSGRAVLDVYGDGPEMPKLRAIIKELDIEQGVNLHGWIEHHRLQEQLVKSDLLVFPSVREFGGGCVLEAMALGLVPIIVDYAGPAELVTDRTGFKIPIGTREEILSGVRRTLQDIADDPGSLQGMGQRAREYVFEFFTWSAKAQQTLGIYDWVLGRCPEKPCYGMPISREATIG